MSLDIEAMADDIRNHRHREMTERAFVLANENCREGDLVMALVARALSTYDRRRLGVLLRALRNGYTMGPGLDVLERIAIAAEES